MYRGVHPTLFQLTPSRRATSLYFWIASSSGLFQLTPSRRATSVGNISATEVLVFQLTPSRRATTGLMPQKRHTAFQLTPSRRATWIYRTIGEFFSFQLTPSRRATHRISMILSRQDISTHALTEGDSGREPMTTPAAYFNSRPHGGRRHCTSG